MIQDMSIELWVEKYRPKKLDDYVWRDQVMKNKIKEWINQGAVPHLILSGKSGLGKTSLAHLIINELNVPTADILEVNASKARGISEMEDSINGFISTYPMFDNKHDVKYVILEEADSMSHLAQKFLRAELEKNVNHVRFIFTCNYRNKIEPAIIGRCQEFTFQALNENEFINRVIYILDQENVEYTQEDLVDFIDKSYPDLRKCIGMIQNATIDGKLYPLTENDGRSYDYMLEVSEMFSNGKHKEARELITSNATPEQYPDIFRFLYTNLELWGDTTDKQDDALIIIRDGVYKHNIVCDQEINLSATILELTRNKYT